MIGHGYEILSVVVNYKGNMIVTGGSDKSIKIWKLKKYIQFKI